MKKEIIAHPTAQQILWQEQELGVLIHYLMDIYAPHLDPKEIKTKKVRTELSPDKINPTNLDVDQWVRSAYELGAKYAILVTNHCSGFSLWQTKVNDYCTRSLAWKNSKGDIVRDFIDACKKYNIKPGLYYSTAVNGYYDISDEVPQDYNAPYYREYVCNVEKQVTELWSEYGELFEIWFDGGIIPVELGGPDLEPILRMHQPNALCFGGPKGYHNNLRWVGNEEGLAPENCWASYNEGDEGCEGCFDGKYYCPAETDTPNRSCQAFGGGWAWKQGEESFVRSPKELLNCYITSVGRNSNLLLGMAIGTSGQFEDEEQFIEFGKLLKHTFGKPISENDGKPRNKNEFNLQLPKDKNGKYIVIREEITEGQHIKGFTISVDNTVVYEGKCIGHKRIIPITVTGNSVVTLKITDAVIGWNIRDIAIY